VEGEEGGRDDPGLDGGRGKLLCNKKANQGKDMEIGIFRRKLQGREVSERIPTTEF